MDVVLFSAFTLLGMLFAALAGLIHAEVRGRHQAVHRGAAHGPYSHHHARQSGIGSGRARAGERAWQRRPAATFHPANPWAPFVIGPGTGRDDIKRQYRALAHAHHPDHGGDPRTMARINVLYAELLRQSCS